LMAKKTTTRKPAKRDVSGGNFKTPPRWLHDALAGSSTTSTGISIGPETALNYSVVWACVRVISETIGSLPWFTYRRTPDGGRNRAPDHPAYRLLHDAPNPDMAAMSWKETSVAHALLWGNCFSEIIRDEGETIAALYPIHPCRVTMRRRPDGSIFYEISNGPNPPSKLDADEMFHVPGLSDDGLWGYSVVQKARESFGLLAASEKFGGSFFGNGAHFSGVLKHPKALSDKGRVNLKESVEAAHRGADKAHRFMLLEEGMDWSQTSVPPNDAQFLETRQFQVEEICRWFRVPPHKVQHLLRSTFSNIEHQSIEHVTDTLRPWLVRFEQEANRKLIRPAQRGTFYTENLLDALLRGDTLSRSQALEVQFRNGVLLGDEWRSIENRNPLPDGVGQRPIGTVNMVPLDKMDEILAAKTAPKAPPAGDSGGDAKRMIEQHLAAVGATRGDAAAAAESRRIAKLIESNLE
jgi:HK97 family phage portal protein